MNTKEKTESKIFIEIARALKKSNKLKCDQCNKKCDEYTIAMGIDYGKRELIGKSCIKCWHKNKYGKLTRKEYDFVMRLENVQGSVQRFSELAEMGPKERETQIKSQLNALKSTLRFLESEAKNMNLERFIRK